MDYNLRRFKELLYAGQYIMAAGEVDEVKARGYSSANLVVLSEMAIEAGEEFGALIVNGDFESAQRIAEFDLDFIVNCIEKNMAEINSRE